MQYITHNLLELSKHTNMPNTNILFEMLGEEQITNNIIS